MKRVLILVEGQTEETFVKATLAPHLLTRGLALIPRLVVTRYNKAGSHDKGGINRYKPVKDDLRRLLADTGVARVTTMLDYYGLPEDFPGMEGCGRRSDHAARRT